MKVKNPLYDVECKAFYNTKTKVYKDGSKNHTFCHADIFKDPWCETENDRKRFIEKYEQAEKNGQEILDIIHGLDYTYEEQYYIDKAFRGLERIEQEKKHQEKLKNGFSVPRSDSLKRAKDSVFDLVLNNDFKYFFTGTINPDKFDSKNPNDLFKPVQTWLRNMVQRYGLKYIVIAEPHKKGGIHFHGLFDSEIPLKLEDSGTKKYYGYKAPMKDRTAKMRGLDVSKGQVVYNLHSWSFGWTTCIDVYGNKINLAYYITKYITKDLKKIFGRFYWHSRNVVKPQIVYSDSDYQSLELIEYNGFKYKFEGSAYDE